MARCDRRSKPSLAANLVYGVALSAIACLPLTESNGNVARAEQAFVADGRGSLDELSHRFSTLSAGHGWKESVVYEYPGDPGSAIRAWHTPHRGEALWIIAGIHGEEPAGPNAIARALDSIVDLAASGVPVVLIPLANPRAYRNNWRYPNTPERDWRKGGYSVGDAEHLLPRIEDGTQPRSAGPPGPEPRALTAHVLSLARTHPPRLVLDLHEDELSTTGGYIYSQGDRADDNPVGAAIIDVLQASGISIRLSGQTRFGEPIVTGVISRDDQGRPIRDGSIDELLSAIQVFVNGVKVPGPSAPTVIVVETPAFAGSRFESRVAAQAAVLQRLETLWQRSAGIQRRPDEPAH